VVVQAQFRPTKDISYSGAAYRACPRTRLYQNVHHIAIPISLDVFERRSWFAGA
jgi:hypothetical protein